MSFDMDLPGMKPIDVVSKDWGVEKHYVNRPDYCLKLLLLYEGFRGSLHRHRVKTETFVVMEGNPTLEWSSPWGFAMDDVYLNSDRGSVLCGLRKSVVTPDYRLHLLAGSWHRFSAEHNNVAILEVSTHDWPDDVERLEKGGEVPDVK